MAGFGVTTEGEDCDKRTNKLHRPLFHYANAEPLVATVIITAQRWTLSNLHQQTDWSNHAWRLLQKHADHSQKTKSHHCGHHQERDAREAVIP